MQPGLGVGKVELWQMGNGESEGQARSNSFCECVLAFYYKSLHDSVGPVDAAAPAAVYFCG